MSDRSTVHPNYQGMLEIQNRTSAADAVSATQAQLLEMDPGARWSHQASHQAYAGGGNLDGVTNEALGPEGQPQGSQM